MLIIYITVLVQLMDLWRILIYDSVDIFFASNLHMFNGCNILTIMVYILC